MNPTITRIKLAALACLVAFAMWIIVFLLTLYLTWAILDYLRVVVELAQLNETSVPA